MKMHLNGFAAALLLGALAGPVAGVAGAAVPVLRDINVVTRAAVDYEPLKNSIQTYINRPVTAELLQNVLNEISQYYQTRGYPGSRAFIPEQVSTDGTLKIVVMTPKIEDIVYTNQSGLKKEQFMKLFGGIEEFKGSYVNSKELDARLRPLSELGLFDIHGWFEPGQEDDGNILRLSVKKRSPFAYKLFADNHGTKASGRYRVGAQGLVRNLTGHGDQLSGFMAHSDENQNNLALGYEIPVNSHPTVLGAGITCGTYELGEEYEVLGAEGYSMNFELFVREPLWRSEHAGLNLTGGVRYRRLVDKFEEFDLEFKKHTTAAYAQLDSTYFTPRWRLKGELRGTFGRLSEDDDWEIYEDEKSYGIFNLNTDFSYKFTRRLQFKNRNSIQYSPAELESSERLQAGGPLGVRAFESSIASGDSGVVSRLSLSWMPFADVDFAFGPGFDYAWVKNNHSDCASLSGAGMQASVGAGGFFAEATAARVVGTNYSQDEREYRVWLNIGYRQV